MEKIGEFDWILNWVQMRTYLYDYVQMIDSDADKQVRSLRALVIGCGTSPLSNKIAELGCFSQVVSIDNDAECISHMKHQNAGNALMQWHVYDMIERYGPPASSQFLEEHGSFDLIIDKGTFDAILVEGVSYPMLCEVHRLLATNGYYLLCSIHTKELLNPLLSTPILGFEIMRQDDIEPAETSGLGIFNSMSQQDDNTGTIMLCKKIVSMDAIDEGALAVHEKNVMDFYYQEERPLLTVEYLQNLESSFFNALQNLRSEQGWIHDNLPFALAHSVLFKDDEALGYTLDLFLGDLERFPVAARDEGRISLSEIKEFLKAMQ